MSVPAAAVPPPRYWISRPSIDVLIGCGGLSVPLLAASYLLAPGDSRVWAGAFYTLALAANYPHYMATIYRAYGAADRGRHTVYTVYGTAVLLLLGAAAHYDFRLLTLLFSAYVMWSPWHYSGQNYGLLVMFLRRGGVDIGHGERRALRLAFLASYVLLLSAFHEGRSTDPLVISFNLPLAFTRTIGAAAGLAFVAVGLAVFVRLARRHRGVRFAAPTLLCVTQGLWFVVPIVAAWVSGVAAPQARYSSGVLALVHASQYLWITQYFARREQGPAWAGSRYWIAVVLGGMALFLPVPWLASYATGVDFTASMLVVTAIVNLHHFMIDGVVWKLRDPRVGRALSGSSTPEVVRGATAVASTGRWRVGVALAGLALVGLAAVDQWRYWLALRDTDPTALAAAARLNPHDRLVQGRLVRVLTERGELDQAQRHLEDIVSRAPRNADARVNAGVLARRTGQTDAALEHWSAAIDLDPTNASVQLYLAELLDELGRDRDAAFRYRRYLELVAEGGAGSADRTRVAAVVIKFGDALARLGQPDAARRQFDLARSIARSAGASALEAEASRRLGP